jgi:hypothetical protein
MKTLSNWIKSVKSGWLYLLRKHGRYRMFRNKTTSSENNSSSSSTKPSVKFVGLLILVASPFILLWLIDRLFSFVHTNIYPEYFPSEREVMIKYNIMPARFLEDQKAFMEEVKSSKVKVAIFGGSSAVGYAAPIGFARFLEEAAPGRLLIHNYAEAGAPFVGFQAELAKVVMPYYDVILVYAGHNEIWSYLYRRSREMNEEVALPWGAKVDYRGADFRHSLKLMELKKLFNDDLLGADTSYIRSIQAAFWGTMYDISLNSRFAYFVKSIGSKVVGASKAINQPPTRDDAERLPFFQKQSFIGNDIKQGFVDDYRNSVLDIENKLRSDQKLIVSTVLSNDLFPPLLDVVDEDASIADAENKAASLYNSVGALKSSDELSTLAGSAHKAYLNAALCLGGLYPINSENRIEQRCLDIARAARESDALPLRAVPGINGFIKSLAKKGGNVYVIDPETLLNEQRSQSDYLDFFVDFQHPSSLGHMTIANDVLSILLPRDEIELSRKGGCDEFSVRDSGEERLITPKREMLETQLRTNMNWLDGFLKRTSTPFMYDFYRKRAAEKLRKCAAQSTP